MFKNQPEILFALVTISIVFLVLASLIGLIVYLHKKKVERMKFERKMLSENYEKILLQSQIEVQESTLATLGRELHDNVGQLMSSARMLLGITERSMSDPPGTLLSANETLGKAINELRALSKSLNKEWLEQFDLIENLRAETERINPSKEIIIHLSSPARLTLEADAQIILFRIIQEAIQNAIKHAAAKNIHIDILPEVKALKVFIKDDGKGFDENHINNGVGIINMKQRTQLLNGNIEWINTANGAEIRILLPNNKTES